jgi:hypothetical protein
LTLSLLGARIAPEMSAAKAAGEHAIDGFRVVPSKRRAGRVRPGDPVVVLPVEAVLADARLLELPTVRRVARGVMRGVVLVPLAEWRERLSAVAAAE